MPVYAFVLAVEFKIVLSFLNESTKTRRTALVLSITRSGANVFDQHKKMSAIGGRRHKSEMPVEPGGEIVFRVDGKGAHPDNIGNLLRAAQGIQEEPRSDPTALPFAVCSR